VEDDFMTRILPVLLLAGGLLLPSLDLAEHGGHAYDLSGPTSILEAVAGPSRALGRPATSLAKEPA
jgi:hypothetical protein